APPDGGVCGERVEQLRRGEPAALPRREPLVHLQAPGLLERVGDRVLVAAERERAAGVAQRTGGTDAVGEVAFGRGTQARGGAAATEQRDVGVGQMRGV